LLAGLAVASLLAAANPAGHLVVVGGGPTQPEVMQRALELAGGPRAAIVVLPQASATPEAGRTSVEYWRGLGGTNVHLAVPLTNAAARAAIERASLIWMPGGSQRRLLDALTEAGLVEVIRQRHARGAVVGGTSAGAAVLSDLMITGEAELTGVGRGTTEVVPGLGLWPGVMVDQHFLKRQRFNRLLAAVLDHPDHVGVGIDEETAVVVSAGRWEVIGRSQVLVLDARQARHAPADDTALRPAAADVRLHVLRAGMTWAP
jgi:cyanophycinase